ncbi:unnamed protein product, partial [Staurois parvus]
MTGPIRADGWDDRSQSERDGRMTARGERAWYRGSKRRMVGVTSQVQQVAGSVVPRVRQKDGQERAGVRAGEGQHKSEQAEFGNKEAYLQEQE